MYLILCNRLCVKGQDYEFNLLVPCLCIFFNNVIFPLFISSSCVLGFVGRRIFGVNLGTLYLHGISVLYAKTVSLTFL